MGYDPAWCRYPGNLHSPGWYTGPGRHGLPWLFGPYCRCCRLETQVSYFRPYPLPHGMVKYGATSYINYNVQGENGVLRSELLLDYDSGELLEVENDK